MKQVFAPWRIEWVEKEERTGDSCVFCSLPKEENDAENLIVARSKYNYILMNNYPYNPGHILVIPYSHIKKYEDIDKETLLDHGRMKQRALSALSNAFEPEGFNTGMNLGDSSGGSIDDHVHTHIVPRWGGDTNFMPVISDTKVIVEGLKDSYGKLRESFKELKEANEKHPDSAIDFTS